MSLKETLHEKLAALREINDQPENYLKQFFYSLRNEIALQSEVMLCNRLDQNPNPDKALSSEHERIIKIRRYFFSGFAKMEKEFIWRIKFGAIDWTPYHTRLQELTKLVAEYNPDSIDLDNVFLPKIRDRAKYEFDSIAMQLDEEIERVKCELFNNKTIFFEKSCQNGFGILVIFSHLRFNEHEVGYLRSKLSEVKTGDSPKSIKTSHDQRDLKPLFKSINDSINKKRLVNFEDGTELSKHVLVLDKFHEYITKCMNYSLRKNKEPLYHIYIDMSVLNQNDPIDKSISEIYFDWNQLDLSKNSISGIQLNTFSYYTNLKRLDLRSNNLKALKANTLDQLVYLTELNLASNQLAEVDKNVFAKMKKLRKLDLSHNLLDEHMLTGTIPISHLKKLDLSHNRISVFNFKSLLIPSNYSCKLRRLDLSHNFIENLAKSSFAKLDNLKSLNLSHNRIGTVAPKTFKLLSSLEHLDLSSNGIAEICKHNFKSLSSLKLLMMSNNIIGRLEAGSFKRLTKLEILCLDGNEIDLIGCENFLETNLQLHQLNLAHNNITGLSAKSGLSKLENLRALKLNHNPLSYIGPDSFKCLKNLRQLCLNNCQLSRLDIGAFQSLEKLTELYLNKNPLGVEEVDSLSRMELPVKFKVIYDAPMSGQEGGDLSELSNSKISEICSLGLFF